MSEADESALVIPLGDIQSAVNSGPRRFQSAEVFGLAADCVPTTARGQ